MERYLKVIDLLAKLREEKPLVHHITNYVTVNDCANITLAIGASPVMADDINEVEEMVSMASSLVLNIGTLNERTIHSMLAAGKKANDLNIPIVLDPVGVGATSYRTGTAKRLIKELNISVIKGNISEISTLYGMDARTKGVDAEESGDVSENDIQSKIEIAKKLASNLNCVIAITGAIDIITDGIKVYTVENGDVIMSRITGTGCMCASLIGSFCAVSSNALEGALAGVLSMGIVGEIAKEKIGISHKGTGSLKVEIMDGIYNLNKDIITKRGKVYEK
ncbi:hydroxyethylthiazole kinase [Clostridium amylolyticum]|uniref:Hydroxyethylthiazole kinase n=1 Tax=Clostridium amylolyticum TaxID=1121298 RepID=A0A1M6IJF1_9CLOT|nr:hydroxyethylthiazole kinase [Clostridium amylolyticum]SHJ34538.1 hydroxyethylthiazole kinase [Clostridium amylolyticum]